MASLLLLFLALCFALLVPRGYGLASDTTTKLRSDQLGLADASHGSGHRRLGGRALHQSVGSPSPPPAANPAPAVPPRPPRLQSPPPWSPTMATVPRVESLVLDFGGVSYDSLQAGPTGTYSFQREVRQDVADAVGLTVHQVTCSGLNPITTTPNGLALAALKAAAAASGVSAARSEPFPLASSLPPLARKLHQAAPTAASGSSSDGDAVEGVRVSLDLAFPASRDPGEVQRLVGRVASQPEVVLDSAFRAHYGVVWVQAIWVSGSLTSHPATGAGGEAGSSGSSSSAVSEGASSNSTNAGVASSAGAASGSGGDGTSFLTSPGFIIGAAVGGGTVLLLGVIAMWVMLAHHRQPSNAVAPAPDDGHAGVEQEGETAPPEGGDASAREPCPAASDPLAGSATHAAGPPLAGPQTYMHGQEQLPAAAGAFHCHPHSEDLPPLHAHEGPAATVPALHAAAAAPSSPHAGASGGSTGSSSSSNSTQAAAAATALPGEGRSRSSRTPAGAAAGPPSRSGRSAAAPSASSRRRIADAGPDQPLKEAGFQDGPADSSTGTGDGAAAAAPPAAARQRPLAARPSSSRRPTAGPSSRHAAQEAAACEAARGSASGVQPAVLPGLRNSQTLLPPPAPPKGLAPAAPLAGAGGTHRRELPPVRVKGRSGRDSTPGSVAISQTLPTAADDPPSAAEGRGAEGPGAAAAGADAPKPASSSSAERRRTRRQGPGAAGQRVQQKEEVTAAACAEAVLGADGWRVQWHLGGLGQDSPPPSPRGLQPHGAPAPHRSMQLSDAARRVPVRCPGADARQGGSALHSDGSWALEPREATP